MVSPPPTPIFQRQDTNEFATALHRRLDTALIGYDIRRKKYGDAADEWLPGHTPTEMVEKRAAEVEKMLEAMANASASEWESEDNIEGDETLKKESDCFGRKLNAPGQSNFPTPSPSSVDTPKFASVRQLVPKSRLPVPKSRYENKQRYCGIRGEKWHTEECVVIEQKCQSPKSKHPIIEGKMLFKKRRIDETNDYQRKRVRMELRGTDRPRRSARLRHQYQNIQHRTN